MKLRWELNKNIVLRHLESPAVSNIIAEILEQMKTTSWIQVNQETDIKACLWFYKRARPYAYLSFNNKSFHNFIFVTIFVHVINGSSNIV